ncbi:MAG: 23S rRNA (pseudouridine(1915)-N(3))-methyltransferase RlmH [Acholeplasmatales bacterium]
MIILAVGKIRDSLEEEINFYKKQMPKLKIIEIKDSDKEKEGKLLLKHMKDNYCVSLSIEGKAYDSVSFSKHVEKLQENKNLTFIIGGSEGLSDEVLNECREHISFSKMTFPHGLMRLILVEQLYRATKISENHPYHK